MDKNKLTQFLLKARTKTYAGHNGRVEPLIAGSKQMEYKEGVWLYRDIFNIGNSKFAGLETVYFKNKPIWSMSYYGNFEKMTEEESDRILRKVLIDKWNEVRLWNNVKYEIGDFLYINEGSGNIDEVEGSEKIEKNGKTVFFFYYAGGYIG